MNCIALVLTLLLAPIPPYTYHFPWIETGAPAPLVGYAGKASDMINLADERTPSHDWSMGCGNVGSIPEIWGDSADYEAELRHLVDSSCNDGRPVLFLNEPAYEEQANVTPERAADMLYALQRSGWNGGIYVGGNTVEESAWDDALIDAYVGKYGSCDALHPRCVPGITGFHVHLYTNATAGWNPNPDSMEGHVTVEVNRLRAYIEKRRMEGNPTSIIVSEAGHLSKNTSDVPAILEAMNAFAEQLGAIPEVRAWMWYMAKSWPIECCYFPGSDLVGVDGQPTVLGLRWHELALH